MSLIINTLLFASLIVIHIYAEDYAYDYTDGYGDPNPLFDENELQNQYTDWDDNNQINDLVYEDQVPYVYSDKRADVKKPGPRFDYPTPEIEIIDAPTPEYTEPEEDEIQPAPKPTEKPVKRNKNEKKLIRLKMKSYPDVMIHTDGEEDSLKRSSHQTKSMQTIEKEIEEKLSEIDESQGGIKHFWNKTSQHEAFITITVILVTLAMITATLGLYIVKRNESFRNKLQHLMGGVHDTFTTTTKNVQDYQDLCRQRMSGKCNDQPGATASTSSSGVKGETISSGSKKKVVICEKKEKTLSSSSESSSGPHGSRSSTSSWSEEPVTVNMDISTGHMILSYMEDHLRNRDRLNKEWESLCTYEPDVTSTVAGKMSQNRNKNRFPEEVLPFDHTRVILNDLSNCNKSDYINANSITDHDPRHPVYIATQGPLSSTSGDFWQMVWESGSRTIVMLTRCVEGGSSLCHRYWPEEGSKIHGNYEIHLVSEHIWCEDFMVRSLYLKNMVTNETRTVTQFHFLSWPEKQVPSSVKSFLDFRRKVNKSFRGKSCPIVVHCSDGIGRTGTYILIDMVLNRMAKGAKEIDIAATLEHLRDQRMQMVKTKAQFEFVLKCVAFEVQAMLRMLQGQTDHNSDLISLKETSIPIQ